MTLNDDARRALQTLANATAFGGEAVGYAGQPVAAVAALRRLLTEPQGAAALQLVVDQGTRAGQLLALSGLYYADHRAFEQLLVRYRSATDSVPVHLGGCFIGFDEQPVATLISAPGAMQLAGPHETLAQWTHRHPTRTELVYDIEGGGWPMALAGR
ncbi:MAG: hypothetical protein JRI68_19770 [Deltaproteobacteria bacterium]|nr:hypothetical protein [Deltaproteobacteria bacterium]